MPRPVTRADVARYAGVSTAVVSYVINDGPKPVAKATAARVRDAIEVLGYRPNLSARALVSGLTKLIALVVSDISNPFFADYALQVQIQAQARGYAVLMANAFADPQIENRVIDDLVGRQVDGLILASVGVQHERIAGLRRRGLATVVIDAAVPVQGLASLGSAAVDGSRQAVDHLIQVHGHREVAMVVGMGVPGVDTREQGWLAATRSAGLPDGPISRQPFTREGGYEAGLRLFSASNRPTAVFTSSDLQGVGIMRAAHAMNLRVPDDVAVVSFDGTIESAFTSPPMTAAHQPVEEMAAAAVRLVLDDDASADSHLSFPMSLVVRESCGCPPNPSALQSSRRSASHRGVLAVE